ncbi:MAG: DUF84 family protein [Parcubacteria group bacterium]|nr:DUF84 family protein [Parcubacteria group bacterium]MCR4342653.1 DUF84 family protein [Patescibacteria group bacterium]
MKIVLGSRSKRKIDVAEKIFKQIFNNEEVKIVAHNAASGVPETPYNKETFGGKWEMKWGQPLFMI